MGNAKQPIEKRPCIITIDPNCEDIDVKTGTLHTLDIIDALNGLQKLMARRIVEEARQHVGDDPEAQARWIDLQRQNRNNEN